MRYLLDFDRTLFDTDAFKKAVLKAGYALGTPESLEKVDASRFVFSDALTFLKTHAKEDMYIVSSCTGFQSVYDRAYQSAKIAKSRVDAYVADVIVVEDTKVDAVVSLADGETVFVDDMDKHLSAVAARCPEVHVVHIGRSAHYPTTRTVPSIASLSELDATIEALCR
ncbi:MAG: hypothetical protein LR017_01620 [Candidatus Pacebacteria bacterium]|nr:hypothetical protein [Candidatus Paceibacterota bacterium]